MVTAQPPAYPAVSMPVPARVEVPRPFLREHPGHVLDSWPLSAN